MSSSPSTLLPPSTRNKNKILKLGLHTPSTAVQTLGEEYTDIWQSTAGCAGLSQRRRLALILLPVLPTYVVAKLNVRYPPGDSTLGKVRQSLPATLEIAGEVNLALFYLRGVYYDLVKRVLGIRYVRVLCNPALTCKKRLNLEFCFALALISSRKSRQSATIVLSFGDSTCFEIGLSSHFVASFSKNHCRSFSRFIGNRNSNNTWLKRVVGGILR